MPDAKVIQFPPRTYRCSFETGSASAVAHVAVIAASFGVRVDIREEPSDHPEPQAPSPLSDPGSFTGDGVRLDL
jgi:hypothetical protein